MVTTLTRTKVPGDLLVHAESLEYCTVPAIIRNGSGGAVTIGPGDVGFPLIAGTNGADYNLAIATEEAGVVALLFGVPAEETVAATTNFVGRCSVVKNAPVVINKSIIATADKAAAAFTLATIVTALKALKWEVRDLPVKNTVL